MPPAINPYAVQQLPNYGAQTPVGSTGGGSNWWSNMDPNTRAALVQGAFGVGGGLIAGYGQSKQNSENNAANAEQAALNRALQLYMAQMDQRQRQAEMGVQAAQSAPTRQDWRQRQAILGDVMPGLRNAQVTPPGDLGRFMPQISGGMRLPEGGLSPEALAFFSPGARVAAEADLDRAGAVASGGQAPVPDYAGVGYGQAGQGPGQDVTNYSAGIRQRMQDQSQQQGFEQAVGRLTQTQTDRQRQQAPQNQGPSTGQRLASAAIGAGLAYAGSRWGGQGQQQGQQGGGQQSPWLQMAMMAAGGYFGR